MLNSPQREQTNKEYGEINDELSANIGINLIHQIKVELSYLSNSHYGSIVLFISIYHIC